MSSNQEEDDRQGRAAVGSIFTAISPAFASHLYNVSEQSYLVDLFLLNSQEGVSWQAMWISISHGSRRKINSANRRGCRNCQGKKLQARFF